MTDSPDGLRTIYRAEGTRGLYKGSLLALVGVSNGSIQFATYEEIKRRRTDIKRKLFASQGKEWKVEDEKLVSAHRPCCSSTLEQRDNTMYSSLVFTPAPSSFLQHRREQDCADFLEQYRVHPSVR